MYEELGDAIVAFYWFCIISLLITIPLAIWKLIEIVIWLFRHITVDLK